jgi:predicted HTH domain antitoxin
MKIELDLELPGEVLEALKDEDLAAKVKEALVMELLREHRVSQGKAAELLGISRSELFPLMAKYQVSVIDLSPDELGQELDKPFPPQ